jgi:hypothetical protein
MVFLENTNRRSVARTLPAPRAAGISGSSSGWACLILAVLGLGGGLAMAFFSFNSSESSPRIAGVPREIIYLPPPGSMSPETTSTTATSDASGLHASAGELSARSFSDLGAVFDDHDFRAAETSELANAGTAFAGFDASSARSLAAFSAAPSGTAIATPSAATDAPVEAAFSGVLLPVPEPSTWAMMLSGAGVLIAALRNRKRRQ